MTSIARCNGPRCKTRVLFAIDENGKRLPLDVSAPVYRVTLGEDGQPRATRDKNCMVLHHSTCVDVGKF